MAPRLIVVGCGIQAGRDLSTVALHHVRTAEKVLYLVADPATALWLHELNQSAESLHGFYSTEKPRLQTYEEMTAHIMSFVEKGTGVCVVSYGHPGIFAYPTHKVIELARRMGVEAVMLPAVSSIDCLIADLGIDPAHHGFQIYDATDLLLRRHRIDPTAGLVILQIAVAGDAGYREEYSLDGLKSLVEKLSSSYGPNHECVLYDASPHPIATHVIQRVPLAAVPSAKVSAMSTLYIPPKSSAPVDEEMLRRFPGE